MKHLRFVYFSNDHNPTTKKTLKIFDKVQKKKNLKLSNTAHYIGNCVTRMDWKTNCVSKYFKL